jgi:hypothetical protein
MDKIKEGLLAIVIGIVFVAWGKSTKDWFFKRQFLVLGYLSLVSGIVFFIIGLLSLFPSSVTKHTQILKPAAPIIIYTAASTRNHTQQSDSLMQHIIDSISARNIIK